MTHDRSCSVRNKNIKPTAIQFPYLKSFERNWEEAKEHVNIKLHILTLKAMTQNNPLQYLSICSNTKVSSKSQ